MSLTYIDSRDIVARSQFIEEAPSPLPGVPLNAPHFDVFIAEEQQRRQGRPTAQQRPPRETRPYRRVTNEQKLELTELFRQYGDDKPAEWYSQQVGVRLSRTRDLLSRLRNGQSVMPKGHYHRRSRVEPFQWLITRGLTRKPTISISCLLGCLQKLVDECGAVSEDDVLAIDPERLDHFVDGEERSPEERGDESGLSASVNFTEGGSVTLWSDDGNEVAPFETDDGMGSPGQDTEHSTTNSQFIRVPSTSSILTFVRGERGDVLRREIPAFSFKRETVRGVNANSDENKDARIEAINELNDMIRAGYRWVSLDESSWRVGCTSVYGWSPRGSRCFITKAKNGMRVTSIASIDSTGMGDCYLVCGSTDKELFEATFRRLIKTYDDSGVRCVFWCDNCSLHNGMSRLVEGTIHRVVYNAPYSPELNPIENVFAIWKRRAESTIRTWEGLDDFLRKIRQSFLLIEPHEVLASIEKCRSDVWAKALRREDL